jgi:hypothetical protein
MLVKATRLGYYDHLRRKPGEVFKLKKAEHFSDSNREKHPGWMEKVEEGEFETRPRGKSSKVKANPGKPVESDDQSDDEVI